MSSTKFWAGGSRDGWFVKMSREQEVYPGDKLPDVMVKAFPIPDYGTELKAAHAADTLAERLNAAIQYERDDADYYFSRQATPAEIRAEFKRAGRQARISLKTGEVRYRPLPDRYPGCDSTWLFGGYVTDFRYHDDAGVLLP